MTCCNARMGDAKGTNKPMSNLQQGDINYTRENRRNILKKSKEKTINKYELSKQSNGQLDAHQSRYGSMRALNTTEASEQATTMKQTEILEVNKEHPYLN